MSTIDYTGRATGTVNLLPGFTADPVIHIKQGDVGRAVQLWVYDSQAVADLSDVEAVLQGTKPSGLGFTVNGDIPDISGGGATYVAFLTTKEMTAEAGEVAAEVIITRGDLRIASQTVRVIVDPSAHPDGTMDGTAESVSSGIALQARQVKDEAITQIYMSADEKISEIDAAKASVPTAQDVADELSFEVEGGVLNVKEEA